MGSEKREREIDKEDGGTCKRGEEEKEKESFADSLKLLCLRRFAGGSDRAEP